MLRTRLNPHPAKRLVLLAAVAILSAAILAAGAFRLSTAGSSPRLASDEASAAQEAAPLHPRATAPGAGSPFVAINYETPSEILILDAISGALQTRIPTGRSPLAVYAAARGLIVLTDRPVGPDVRLAVFDRDGSELRSTAIGHRTMPKVYAPHTLALSPDERTVYYTLHDGRQGHTVVAHDIDALQVRWRYELPGDCGYPNVHVDVVLVVTCMDSGHIVVLSARGDVATTGEVHGLAGRERAFVAHRNYIRPRLAFLTEAGLGIVSVDGSFIEVDSSGAIIARARILPVGMRLSPTAPISKRGDVIATTSMPDVWGDQRRLGVAAFNLASGTVRHWDLPGALAAQVRSDGTIDVLTPGGMVYIGQEGAPIARAPLTIDPDFSLLD